ncbi:hypothetical protein AUJ46_04830 [Candidatus Peregrinibacteria bacterium CG1_02_54_53]|nr:MAG: hypothetical protein AUJ46_04830 [Candidatus Peregrinibacteria bacterium CG1_02_54_53]
MIPLDRDEVFRTAEGIYERRSGHPIPSKIQLSLGADLFLQGCHTAQNKAEMLGSIAEKRALHRQCGPESPLSQETFDIIDVVSEALQ